MIYYQGRKLHRPRKLRVSPNHTSPAPTPTTAPFTQQFPSCPAPAPHKLWDLCRRPLPMPDSLLQPSSPARYLGKGHGAPRRSHFPATASVDVRCKTITDSPAEHTLNDISPKVCNTDKLGHVCMVKAKHLHSKMGIASQAPEPC